MSLKNKNITLGIIIDTALKIPPNTGVTYRLYFLSKKLTEKGLKVKLFLCNRNINSNKDAESLFENSTMEYHIIPEKIFYDVKKMKSIIKENSLDILQFEDAISLLRYYEIGVKLNIPICLEMHDVETTLKEFLGYRKDEIKNAQIISHNACRLAQAIVCMTSLDHSELIHKVNVSKGKLTLIPNPIDLDYFFYYGPYIKSFNIIFVGNMFYWPNKNAMEQIAKKIYPEVIKKAKDIKFYFIGMIPKKIRKKYEKDNFIFTGSVDNLNEYLKIATLALCPVIEGSGMKVKLLNYCAAGLPVITSKIGASGYEKVKSLLIENDIDNYPNVIVDLLNHHSKLKKIGRSNRKYIEKNFDINDIADKTIRLYKKMIDNFQYKNRIIRKKRITKLVQLLWLDEKRVKTITNKNYYIINNGKIIYKKEIA
ncbi:glycosyltransferase family 4 protein [Patescibacteria group bacterium]|nr:glycosyltransferase family 4 protein [Patescibacteria group bacterium]